MNQQIQPQQSSATAPVVPFAAPQPGLQTVGVAVDARFVLNVNELLRERDELLRRNALLEQEVQRLSAEAGVVNFAKLQELEEEVEETRSLNEDLQRTVEVLRKENQELTTLVQELRGQLMSLAKRVSDLEKRDSPITVREVVRRLEGCICLDVAGSKKKAKALFNFAKFKEHGRFEAITKVVDPRVTVLIDWLKDCGDRAAHDERPILDLATFQALIEDVDDDKDEVEAKVQLIALLRKYKLVNNEDKIVI